ncbi:MAG: Do family serine endopeptidase, partial [Burkholderiaceae bacterium]
MHRNILTRGILAASIAAVLAGGYAHFDLPGVRQAHALPLLAPAAPAGAAATPATPAVIGPVADFSAIVARYGPAVVNISVTGEAQQQPAADNQPDGPGLDPNDPFYDFFRRFGIPQPPTRGQGRQLVRAEGSGFIVRPDGLILTNAHVVNGAQEVTVKLTDRREFKAKVLGADKQTDVAVIKIDARGLPTVQLGDPDAIRVGEPVLAIGSPYGFENSATAGIVSATSRALPDDTYVPFIQTDAAVNPGNSGGPLFNLKGQVIGINSQIYSRTGGYQGLAFAIPINVAMSVSAQLVHGGKVTRGRLGVGIQEVNQALADSFGLKQLQGALVSSVEPDGPAARAGLQPGDVILRLQGKEVTRSSDLPAQVAALKPGTVATLDVIRDGKPKTLAVTIGEVKDTTLAKNSAPQERQGRLGVAVRPLAPDEQRQAGIAGGLLVEAAGGAAAKAGIQPGDVILSLNGTP